VLVFDDKQSFVLALDNDRIVVRISQLEGIKGEVVNGLVFMVRGKMCVSVGKERILKR